MVDAETYHRMNPDRSIGLKAFPSDSNHQQRSNSLMSDESDCESCESCESLDLGEIPTIDACEPLTDEQCLLANCFVPGFALNEKKWIDFCVDKLQPIIWNSNVFDQLVLPASQKSLVRALVESHVNESADGFDDIIKGKGKGLISILHGPPGVGKTLTAESVAEHTQRPLYIVSSGELGTNPAKLEENLSRILDVATIWKAVLLLDEADVFLESRSLDDLERNSLVSIFLRLLEYYQGMIFLTTNRIKNFDEAFQSRVHVALKYNNLDEAAREKVWKNFMKFDDNKEGRLLLKFVAEKELNGRQIKNCVKTAKSLADAQGKSMGAEHLNTVLGIQEQFEKDFVCGEVG